MSFNESFSATHHEDNAAASSSPNQKRKRPSSESDSTGSSSSSDKRYPKLKARTERAPFRKSQPSVQINEVAKKILTKWGLQPGKGLGPNAEGIRQPILPCMRPQYRGLGANGSGDLSSMQE